MFEEKPTEYPGTKLPSISTLDVRVPSAKIKPYTRNPVAMGDSYS